jgi:aldose 1-epimerase
VIEYRQQAIKLRALASDEFTHMVIYTPPEEDAPFFCLENQTCSTDAINLHHQGLTEMAHLLELRPGESRTGFIQYVVEFER